MITKRRSGDFLRQYIRSFQVFCKMKYLLVFSVIGLCSCGGTYATIHTKSGIKIKKYYYESACVVSDSLFINDQYYDKTTSITLLEINDGYDRYYQTLGGIVAGTLIGAGVGTIIGNIRCADLSDDRGEISSEKGWCKATNSFGSIMLGAIVGGAISPFLFDGEEIKIKDVEFCMGH
jgi:hypothetical protein